MKPSNSTSTPAWLLFLHFFHPLLLCLHMKICTSAFWCDFCDQVLHCDMLQALFFDHIWKIVNDFRDPVSLKHRHTRTRMHIQYLCSVLSADPSSHTPPALPWAVLSTCGRTFSWHYFNVCCLESIHDQITEEKSLLTAPVPPFLSASGLLQPSSASLCSWSVWNQTQTTAVSVWIQRLHGNVQKMFDFASYQVDVTFCRDGSAGAHTVP